MGSDKYFEIFKHANDHDNWDKLIDYSKHYPGINSENRQRLGRVLGFLKQELGKGFLKTTNFNHPINQMISNKVVSSALELIDFGEYLISLKSKDCNYDHLLKKLKSLKYCEREGRPFMWISKPLMEAGFSIEFIVEGSNTSKYGDIKVIDPETNQEIIIEVSRLYPSKSINEYSEQYHRFSNVFSWESPMLLCSGRQLLKVPNEDVNEYVEKLRELKKRAIDSKEEQYLNDEYFEIVVQPHGPKPGVLYKSFDSLESSWDFTDRMIQTFKIHDEVKQIPDTLPGFVYLKVDPLFFWSLDVSSSVNKLANHIEKYKNLYGLVIFAHMDGDLQEFEAKDQGHVYRCKKESYGLNTYFLYVKNYAFKLPYEFSSLERLEMAINVSP